MEKELIYNAKRYLDKDMDSIQDTKASAIKNRTKDMLTVGIVEVTVDTSDPAFVGKRVTGNVVAAEFPITVNPSDPASIDIGLVTGIGPNHLGGLAYDGDGNRIAIDASLNYPQGDVDATTRTNATTIMPVTYNVSSGNIKIPLPIFGQDYYVWIESLDVVDDVDPLSVSKDKFGVTHLSRQVAGYKLITSTAISGGIPTPPTSATKSIYIGKATRTGSGLVVVYTGRIYSRLRAELGEAIVDTTNLAPVDYVDKSIVSLQDHVNTKGSNTISNKNAHGLSVSDIGGASPADIADHRRKQHSPGVVTTVATGAGTGRNSITSMLFPAISGTDVNIKNVVASTEQAYADGELLINTTIAGGIVNPSGHPINFLPDLVTLDVNFNSAPVPANDCYVFVLNGSSGLGTVSAEPVLSTVVADVEAKIASLTLAGKLVICAVKWTAPNLTDIRGFVSTDDGYGIDYRSFGSISSKDIEPADGISGQDVTVGEGVKTEHLQDAAVSALKTDFTVRSANTEEISFSPTVNTIEIVESPQVTGEIGYTMGGFYSKWVGGYIKKGKDGTLATNQQDQYRINDDAVPSAVMPNDVDSYYAGFIPPTGWYAVMAIEIAGTNKYTLKIVPFIKIGTPAGNLLPIVDAHTLAGITQFIASDHEGCQALVLTGTGIGNILRITGNTTNSVTVNSASGLNLGDYLMISPARTLRSKTPSLNPDNFRYLGAIYWNGSSIKQFTKTNNVYRYPMTTTFGVPGGPTETHMDTAVDTWALIPPTAISMNGESVLYSGQSHYTSFNSQVITFHANSQYGGGLILGRYSSIYHEFTYPSQTVGQMWGSYWNTADYWYYLAGMQQSSRTSFVDARLTIPLALRYYGYNALISFNGFAE